MLRDLRVHTNIIQRMAAMTCMWYAAQDCIYLVGSHMLPHVCIRSKYVLFYIDIGHFKGQLTCYKSPGVDFASFI